MSRRAARWFRRHVVGLLAAVLALGALGVVARDEGYPTDVVDVGGGSVWVASAKVGQLALLSGPSGALAAQVKVADADQDLTAVQAGETGYAVNRTTGTVTRVDPVSWQTLTASPLDGAAQGLTVAAGRQAVFTVDGRSGVVVEADPDTLRPRGQPASLVGSVADGASVVDDDGTLWLLDSTTGDLVRFADGSTDEWPAVAEPGAGTLVLVGGTAAVADPSQDRVRLLGDRGTSRVTCLAVDRADDTLRVGRSTSGTVVLTASGARGVLHLTDVADRSDGCDGVVPGVAEPGQDLGAPVEVHGRAFVPNYSTGEVVVVDVASRAVVGRADVLDPNMSFQLAARDGFAFYNDPSSERAGVIDLDGDATEIAKYDVAAPDEGLFEPGATDEPGRLPAPGPPVEPPTNAPPPTPAPTAESTPTPRAGPAPQGGPTTASPRAAPRTDPPALPQEPPSAPPVEGGLVTVTVVVVGPGTVTVGDVENVAPRSGPPTCDAAAPCRYTVARASTLLVAWRSTDTVELLGWDGCDGLTTADGTTTCAVVASDRTVRATFRAVVSDVTTVAAQFSPPNVAVGESTTLTVSADTLAESGDFVLYLVALVPLGIAEMPPSCGPGGGSGEFACPFTAADRADLTITFVAVGAGSGAVTVSVDYRQDAGASAASVEAPITVVRGTPAVVTSTLTINGSTETAMPLLSSTAHVTVSVTGAGQLGYRIVVPFPDAFRIVAPGDCTVHTNQTGGWSLVCWYDVRTGDTVLEFDVDVLSYYRGTLLATVHVDDGQVLPSNGVAVDVFA